ncbi:MAG: PLP-dependent cysteine synthase family protein [Halobacteriales archaeon]
MTRSDEPLPSVLETVGETPLVQLDTEVEGVTVYAKLEAFNPGASVKDRIGRYMLERMLETGTLESGGTIVEATAGNTGIGLAIAAGQLGLEAVFVVPERFSVEKQQLMAALGAEIVTTPTEAGMGHALEVAHEIADERSNAVVADQFSNPLNTEAHYVTTAPEVYDALDGRVGAIVAGCGTAGTLMGLARYGRERPHPPHVVAVEPEGSLYCAFHGGEPDEAEYKIEGIGTHDPTVNALYEPDLVDELVSVADRDAHAEVRRLAAEEGHLVGSSAAANSLAARDVAVRVASGELELVHPTVVTIFPDSSERYLTKGIYGDFEDWAA